MKINLEVNTSDTSDLHTKQAYEVNVITFFFGIAKRVYTTVLPLFIDRSTCQLSV